MTAGRTQANATTPATIAATRVDAFFSPSELRLEPNQATIAIAAMIEKNMNARIASGEMTCELTRFDDIINV